MTTSALFSPLTIRGVTTKNRIMVSPMSQYSAIDGCATDWHFAHCAKFAVGGAGIVFLEATKVERRGLGTIGDTGLWCDAQIGPLRKIADFIRSCGAVPAIQLNHAGAKAGTLRPWEGFGPLDRSVPIEGKDHWDVIGPSPYPHLDGWPTPREMTLQDIDEVTKAWGHAARRAHLAGFDIIEVHGAHGYLLHQFLSPFANRRSDGYGGNLGGRMRLVIEVIREIRRHWPAEKPLFFRASAEDEAGWSVGDTVALAKTLRPLGVDLIDCSAGGIGQRSATTAPIRRRTGYQVPLAASVRSAAEILTAAVGLILSGSHAESILQRGQADIIAIGREFLYNPHWPAHAAQELDIDPEFSTLPPQYAWWLSKRAKSGIEIDTS